VPSPESDPPEGGAEGLIFEEDVNVDEVDVVADVDDDDNDGEAVVAVADATLEEDAEELGASVASVVLSLEL